MRMVAVKIARLIHSPEHFDSIVDIAGYAKTMALILDRRSNGSGNKKAKHAEAQKRYTLKQQERGAKRMCVWVPEGREVEFNLAVKKVKTWLDITH